MKRSLLVPLLLLLSSWGAAPALATGRVAPQRVAEAPEAGSTQSEVPAEVSGTFSGPLDDSSTIVVSNECGTKVDSGDPTVFANRLSVPIADRYRNPEGRVKMGRYTVRYTAVGLGGLDGTSEGSFQFIAPLSCMKHHHHDDDDDDDKHDDHDKDDRHKRDHDNRHNRRRHGGHDGGGRNHDGGMHSSSQHPSSGHDMGPGKHGNKHARHARKRTERNGSGPIAAPAPPRALGANVDAVLLGLALSLALGILGGWFLRTSGPR